MPTAAQLDQIEADKLRRAGLSPEGEPLENEDETGNPETNGSQPAFDEETGDPDAPKERSDDASDQPEDPRSAQIIELERKVSAIQGRLTPAQRDAEDFKRLWRQTQSESERKEAALQQQIEDLQRQLEAQNNKLDLNELLDEDERDELDPRLVNAFAKIADAVAKRRMPKIDARAEARAVLQEERENQVKDYRRRVLSDPTRGLTKLTEYLNDPGFADWSNDEDNDVLAIMHSLRAAESTESVDRYANILSKRFAAYADFKKGGKKKPPPVDVKPALNEAMRRTPQRKLTDAEVDAEIKKAKDLSRSRNPADWKKADAILDNLNQ